MQGNILERLSKKIDIAARVNRNITEQLKQKAIFEDGKEFNYLTQSLQLKAILASEEDSHTVYKEAQAFVSDKKMYSIPLDIKINSSDSLMKIHFNKINTPCSIKLTQNGGDSISFSGE